MTPREQCEKSYEPRVESMARALELEHRIYKLEEELFGNDPALRVIETTLFIDPVFHRSAVIMGAPKYPERMFSHEGWAGWLSARLFAREYGNQPLTVDCLKELNRRFLQRIDPENAGKLRESTTWGGVFNRGVLRPIVCTDEQIATLDANPLLEFDTPIPDDPHYGLIHYKSPPDEIESLLYEVCNDYNQSCRTRGNPTHAAARMQRKLSSIHPFRAWNGGASRILMNLALENAGMAPSAPRDFDQDIFLSLKEWAYRIAVGTTGHMFQEAATGTTDPVRLLNLTRQKQLYDSGAPSFTRATPTIKKYGDGHNRLQYEAFIGKFEAGNFLLSFNPEGLRHFLKEPQKTQPNNF